MKQGKSKEPPQDVAEYVGDETHPRLGDVLRAIRLRKGLSIADVSAASGLNRSTLSRVENHQLSMTYARLVQLSKGLQVDFSELFSVAPAPAEPKVLARRAVTPPGGGTSVVVGEHAYNYLCTDLPGKQMTPMTAVIKARSFEETNGFLRHEGEEFTFVLQGVLELHTEYYNPLRIETGGSVYFEGTMGHTYVAAGKGPTTILCVVSEADSALERALQDPGQGSAPAEPSRRRPKKSARK